MPATRAALYTIKPAMGLVSSAGIIPISPFADSAGPMAKSAHDIATLMDILVDQTKTKMPSGGYTSCLTASFEKISIGALDPEVWNVPPHVTTPNEGDSKQMVSRSSHISDARPVCETNSSKIADINAVYAKVQPLAKNFVRNLPLITRAQIEDEDKDLPVFSMYCTQSSSQLWSPISRGSRHCRSGH
jgi:Asp-tRNA(Asn)/Glu-tRNA(Gln) amidotransferase A subunit family amidase